VSFSFFIDPISSKAYFNDQSHSAEQRNAEAVTKRQNKLVLDQAKASELISAVKDVRLSVRVSSKLVAAAKKRVRVSSDTELLELALSRLALEDDFGAQLVRRKGVLPQNLDLSI